MRQNGVAIRSFRELRGLSLRRLAHLIGTDPGYWSRVETEKQSVGATPLHRAAAALDIPIAAITRETPRDQEQQPGQHPH